MHDNEAQPAVSIVMATYERPSVLAFAIRSVLAQDFADWELIMVGDHCTEETTRLIASFADPRIAYVNLATNFGEQSGPNNVGIARARGKYLAFLNQDDLWFTDHLRSALEWLQAAGADGVVALSAYIKRPAASAWNADDWQCVINGIGIDGRYDPVLTVGPASTLVLKLEAARGAGPWRQALDCFGASSQQWLYRIWRMGADLRTMPHLTLVQIPSAAREQSYVRHDTAEHEFFFARLNDAAALRLLLLDRVEGLPQRPWWRRLAKPMAIATLRWLAHAGLAPSEIIGCISLGFRRGFFIQIRRRARGLPEMERDPEPASLRARYAAERGRDEAQ